MDELKETHLMEGSTDKRIPDFISLDVGEILSPEENDWFTETISQMEKTTGVSNTFATGKPPMVCIGGKTGCVGCAGLLMGRTYGCQSGACSGGVRVKR